MMMMMVDSHIDCSSKSLEEIFEETKRAWPPKSDSVGFQASSWVLYDLLPQGTILRATCDLPGLGKFWSNLTTFERLIHGKPGNPNERIEIFPFLQKDDHVMFLGASLFECARVKMKTV